MIFFFWFEAIATVKKKTEIYANFVKNSDSRKKKVREKTFSTGMLILVNYKKKPKISYVLIRFFILQ